MRLMGITLCHEHMAIDLSGPKGDDDCRLNLLENGTEELIWLKDRGVRNIIDVSNIGIGRDTTVLQRLQDITGINFICSTGFYKDPFLPEFVGEKTEQELANIMIKEITQGIENGVRAQVIGEVGTSLDIITPNEKKVLSAACIAHRETGAPIITHTTLGTMGLEQVKLLEGDGADLSKVVISHPALKKDFGYLVSLLKSGVKIAFDTIGKAKYQSDDVMAQWIKELIDMGYIKSLLMSMDITRKSHLQSKGGVGYCYLFDSFLPLLRKQGVSDEELTIIMEQNPGDLFT